MSANAVRLSFLGGSPVTSDFWLLPRSDVGKNLGVQQEPGVLALRYQLAILRRQIDKPQPGHHGPRAFLHRLTQVRLRQ